MKEKMKAPGGGDYRAFLCSGNAIVMVRIAPQPRARHAPISMI